MYIFLYNYGRDILFLTEIVPDVKISAKESRRPETAKEDLLQALNQSVIPT